MKVIGKLEERSLEAIHEELQKVQDVGQAVTLGDLLRHVGEQSLSGRIHVKTYEGAREVQGALQIRDGKVVDAGLGSLEGEPALEALLSFQSEGLLDCRDGEPVPITVETNVTRDPIHEPQESAVNVENIEKIEKIEMVERVEKVEEASMSKIPVDVQGEADGRSDSLSWISSLEEAVTKSNELNFAMVADREGFLVAAVRLEDRQAEELAASAASVLSVSGRALEGTGRGESERALIWGSQGSLVIVKLGEQYLLAAGAGSTAKLGMVFLDLRELSEKLAPMI